MSILGCYAEENDFVSIPPISSAAGVHRSTYTRCHFHVDAGTSGMFFRSIPFVGGEVTSCWLSWQGYWTAQSGTNWFEGPVMALLSASANQGLTIGPYYNSPNVYSYRIHKYDGSTYTTLVDCPIRTIATGIIYKTDWQITTFNNAATNIKVFINGVLILDDDYDTTGTGATGLGCVAIRSTALSGANYYVSEIIVADEDTRPFALATLTPNAAGDANGWTSAAFGDVSENSALSDATVAYVNSNDADVQLNLSDCPSGTYRVRAVMLSARAVMTGDSTPTGLALGIRNGSGGSLDYGSKQSLTTGWAQYNRLMSTNPVTSSEWTPSELTGLQLNLRSKS